MMMDETCEFHAFITGLDVTDPDNVNKWFYGCMKCDTALYVVKDSSKIERLLNIAERIDNTLRECSGEINK